MTAKHHGLPVRPLIAGVAVLMLIAVHAAMLMLVSRAQLSVVLLAGVVMVVVLKYAWWRLRRGSPRAGFSDGRKDR